MLKIGMVVFPKGLIAPRLYRVRDMQGEVADLAPMSLGAIEMQSPAGELRRYRIRTTDEVTKGEEFAQVLGLVNPRDDDYYEYEIEVDGQTSTVPEYELTVHEGSLAADPADMLAQLDAAPWNLVSARMELLDAFFSATARSLGVAGYNGARMLPIPHQINAARHAIQFGRVRFLLADEVGLGKTVEAGLIVSTLRRYFPSWQTAIFVPESLTAQWAFEMYGKFGKTIFCLDLDEYDPEEYPGVILAHHRARTYCIRNKPEILVVDEAHRVLQDPKLFDAFLRMSTGARAVLLLTATPVSDSTDNLLNLLRILDPEVFDKLRDADHLRDLQRREGRVEALLRLLRREHSAHDEVLAAWAATELEDDEISQLLDAAKDDLLGRHARHRAASLIIDRYHPGARILRYRRKFLAMDNPMPLRVVDALEYKPTEEEQHAMALARQWLDMLRDNGLAEDELAHDYAGALLQAAHSSPQALADWVALRRGQIEPHAGVTADPVRLIVRAKRLLDALPAEEALLEQFDEAIHRWHRATRSIDVAGRAIARAPRYTRLLEFLEGTYADEPDAHLVIFTSFESNVHALYLLLKKAFTSVAEVYEMSGQMDRIEREKFAFEFQEEPGGCILISDELGGEGRNFQFATHVIHFDLPIAPWMVEQRIGRCDRVGRDEEMDVDSQVLVAKGGMDEVFFDFLCDGVGVFNDSIAPVESEMEHVMQRMMSRCIEEGPSGALDLIEQVADELEEARERGNQELLVRSAVGVEEARRIASELRDDAQLDALRAASSRYARLFESMVDDMPGGKLHVTVGEFHTLHGVPGIRPEMYGYFDRKLAVRHERLDFFSPGHPFVRTMASTAMTESPDRVAIVRREGVRQPAALFFFRIQLPQEFIEAARQLPQDLQPPLLSKSAALFHTRTLRVVVSLDGRLLEDAEAAPFLAPWREDDGSCHSGSEVLRLLPKGFAEKVRNAALAAAAEAEREASTLLTERLPEIEDLLCEVLTRVNTDHELVEGEVSAILANLEPLSVDLDAIALFLPG